MNVTDLRDELTIHAADLGAAPDFRAGVAARVRRTRRRRASAAAAATLAVAVLGAGVAAGIGRPAPALPAGSGTASASVSASSAPMTGSDGMPYRAVPDAPGDVVKDGLRYRAEVADDTLAAGFIGDRGQAQFSLVWTPTTTHASFGAECYLPGLTDDQAAAYLVSVSLDGATGFFKSTCSGGEPRVHDLPAGGAVPGEPGRGWKELTVGRAARVRVQLVDAKTDRPAAVQGVQLAGAVYELGEQQPVKDDSGATVAELPLVVEHQGYRYELAGLIAHPFSSWKDDLTTGVGAGQSLVTWGSAGVDPTGVRDGEGTGMRLTGLPDGTEGHGYGSWGTSPVPEGSAHTVTVTAGGKRPDHGTGFLALYMLQR